MVLLKDVKMKYPGSRAETLRDIDLTIQDGEFVFLVGPSGSGKTTIIIIQKELDRRRPGQSDIVTARNEQDKVEILSGLFENKTTGQPIGFIVRNADHHSADYSNIKDLYRPSHADFTYSAKYGIRDYRGGGRSSARETISRVVAGAFAKQALKTIGIDICAYTSQVGDITLSKKYTELDLTAIDSNDVRCPDAETAAKMKSLILDVKKDGDTIGGIITGLQRSYGRRTPERYPRRHHQ